jgi:hypothetical protein
LYEGDLALRFLAGVAALHRLLLLIIGKRPPSLMPFATARASLLGAGADQFALLTDISNG